jgi:hypothetical protein
MKDVSTSLLTSCASTIERCLSWLKGRVGTPEDVGMSPSYFLTRDCSVHEGGIGDGIHTHEELRRVIQNDVDAYERSGHGRSEWDRLQESRRILEAMDRAKVEAVNYLPAPVRDVSDVLRPCVVQLMKIAYEINDGVIDQSVIDRARAQYTGRPFATEILAQIQQIAQLLNLR